MLLSAQCRRQKNKKDQVCSCSPTSRLTQKERVSGKISVETSLFLAGVLQVGLGRWHLSPSLIAYQDKLCADFRSGSQYGAVTEYMPRYLNTTYSVHNDGKTNPAWPPPSKDPVLALQVNSNITALSWKLQTALHYSISPSSVRLSSNPHQQPETKHIEPRSSTLPGSNPASGPFLVPRH